ncbi:MAG: hypothetical protein RH942_10300 [Kiloniellaceae bacterium]
MPDASHPAADTRITARSSRAVTAACLLAVMGLELVARLSGSGTVLLAAFVAMFLTTVVSVRALGLREAYLLTLCAGLTFLIYVLHPHPAAVIQAALAQASFLMAFILLLGLLHEAASTSPAVARCGEYLTKQPPGRRYYALNFGTAAMAVLFNIGVVSLLVPLIQRGIESATPGDSRNPLRERRQVSAMLRGFAWCVIWSPTAIAPLALMELIPGTDRRLWIVMGFFVYLGILVVGSLEDCFQFRAYRPQSPRAAPALPKMALLRFVLACAWLFGMSALVMLLSGETVIFGLMVSCPVMLVGWLLVQNHGSGRGMLAATGARLRTIALENLPKAAPVAITLASSGFVGRAAAALIPAEAWARFLGLDAMPDFVFLSLLPACIALLSLLALSPIMMAVFFGSLIGGLPVLPADPTLIALSISCGWALSMTLSPFATVVLLIDRVGTIPTRRLTWTWNLTFTALAALALIPVFAALTAGQ